MIGLATEYVLARRPSLFRLYRSDSELAGWGWEGAVGGVGGWIATPASNDGGNKENKVGGKKRRQDECRDTCFLTQHVLPPQGTALTQKTST